MSSIDPQFDAPVAPSTPADLTDSTIPSAPADATRVVPDPAPESIPTPPDPARHDSTEFDTESENRPPSLTPATPALSARQLTAISLLIAGKTISTVASILGVHRTTLHNWKNDPDFAAELTRRHAELAAASDARLRLLLLQATHTALGSLHVKDDVERFRNSFRLLSTLRPWMPLIREADLRTAPKLPAAPVVHDLSPTPPHAPGSVD